MILPRFCVGVFKIFQYSKRDQNIAYIFFKTMLKNNEPQQQQISLFYMISSALWVISVYVIPIIYKSLCSMLLKKKTSCLPVGPPQAAAAAAAVGNVQGRPRRSSHWSEPWCWCLPGWTLAFQSQHPSPDFSSRALPKQKPGDQNLISINITQISVCNTLYRISHI